MNLDNQRAANQRAAVGAFLEAQRQSNAQQTPVYQMPTGRQKSRSLSTSISRKLNLDVSR
jgi:hypothetical protein